MRWVISIELRHLRVELPKLRSEMWRGKSRKVSVHAWHGSLYLETLVTNVKVWVSNLKTLVPNRLLALRKKCVLNKTVVLLNLCLIMVLHRYMERVCSVWVTVALSLVLPNSICC